MYSGLCWIVPHKVPNQSTTIKKLKIEKIIKYPINLKVSARDWPTKSPQEGAIDAYMHLKTDIKVNIFIWVIYIYINYMLVLCTCTQILASKGVEGMPNEWVTLWKGVWSSPEVAQASIFGSRPSSLFICQSLLLLQIAPIENWPPYLNLAPL